MGAKELGEYLLAHEHICNDPKLKAFVSELTRFCDFTEDMEEKAPSGKSVYEMGYTISNYRCQQWWSSNNPVNRQLETPKRRRELYVVTELMRKAFPSPYSLGLFCELFAEDLREGHEYNLYYEGRYASYWLHCVIRERNCKLYVHSIVPSCKGDR